MLDKIWSRNRQSTIPHKGTRWDFGVSVGEAPDSQSNAFFSHRKAQLDTVWNLAVQNGVYPMQTIQPPIDYENAIARLVRQLPMERAVQLYDFARFLLHEVGSIDQLATTQDEGAETQISYEELAAEDALWAASMAQHADRFSALKAQAKADVKAQRAVPMFNEKGEFSIE
jgi:hypothetical protein